MATTRSSRRRPASRFDKTLPDTMVPSYYKLSASDFGRRFGNDVIDASNSSGCVPILLAGVVQDRYHGFVKRRCDLG